MQAKISVANTPIRQHNGLYSLNDLHKAAGSSAKHQPSNWLRNKQTIELIDELNRSSNSMNAIETIQGGLNQGTYVCEELVISYGMWINANFALQVIRCFLAKEKASQKITAEQKQQIQAAVNDRHNRTGEHWQSIYKKLHAFCKVNSYHEIESKDFQTALNYLASIQNAPEIIKPQHQLRNIEPLLSHALMCAEFIYWHDSAIRKLNKRLAFNIYDHAKDAICCIRSTADEIGSSLPSHQFFEKFPWDGDYFERIEYRKQHLA